MYEASKTVVKKDFMKRGLKQLFFGHTFFLYGHKTGVYSWFGVVRIKYNVYKRINSTTQRTTVHSRQLV